MTKPIRPQGLIPPVPGHALHFLALHGQQQCPLRFADPPEESEFIGVLEEFRRKPVELD